MPKLSTDMFSALGAVLSALFAGIAVVAAIIIHCQTRNLLRPTERPIIAAIKSKCTGKLINDNNALDINFNLKFKNIGKHPAEKLRMRIWIAPIKQPTQLTSIFDETVANRIYPETDFDWNKHIIWKLPFIYSPEEGKTLDSLKNRPQVFLYFRLDYYDGFSLMKMRPDELYFAYTLGKVSAGHATIEQKQKFQHYINKQQW